MSSAAQADAEAAAEVERDDGVEPEERDLDHRRVEGEPVEVVEDPRKGRLAAIPAALRLGHRARARVPEEASGSRPCGSSSR